MALTSAQQQAVEHEGHLLIVAGPGSGKTTTSVAKAQRILQDSQRRLIMVTFSREGADEMRKRLSKARLAQGGKPYGDDRLRIGTFHSIAIQHLFSHRKRTKLLSPAQQGILLNEAMLPFADDPDMVKELRQEFESFMYAIDRDSLEVSQPGMTVIQRYQERLAHSHATDLYTVMRDCAIQVDRGDIPPMPYTDMLVDEGQDTDELQKVWIFAHARAGVHTTIVGDDDQSIYEWRHALGYRGMKSFMDTFRATRIELGDNFRSREEILNHAGTLIQHNKIRLPKHLVARRGKGGTILAYHTPSSETQCDELAQLMLKCPDSHRQVAVLARRNQSLSDLEMSLTQAGIGYIRIGRSIWDEPWVAAYLSLLGSLIDGSPVGVFGCLSVLGLDEQVRSELLQKMQGHAGEFLEGTLPDLDHATPTDLRVVKEFAQSCKYWRTQLRARLGASVTEVVLDTGDWLSSRQRSPRTQQLIGRAALILSKLTGTLSSRLQFVGRNKKNTQDAAVTLMTMHASKGLEFETVHVIDANQPDDSSELIHAESERRLMYVAQTRAKMRCVVWYNSTPHQTIKDGQLPVLHRFTDLIDRLI